MKTTFRDRLTLFLFCTFLLCTALGYLLLPKSEFSELEKRNLAQVPQADWTSLLSGDWGSEIETYLADHMPGRNFFVGLNAYFDLFTGRQVSKDIWVVEDRLVEAPVQADADTIQRNMQVLHRFAQTLGRSIDLAVAPSAGWSTGAAGYQDQAILSAIYAQAGDPVIPLDLTDLFAGQPDLFYRTDHHWNSDGAYAACQEILAHFGRECPPAEMFRIQTVENFRGSTYSRSALWLTRGEELTLWHGSDSLTVTNGENSQPHSGVFYPERLEEADKYTAFLDGNHSIVRIQNPNAQGKLLVIRDSFSNSLGCFLAEAYGEVVLVDLRYYKQPVSQLVAQEDFADILVCYSIGNFLTDTNLVFLR